LELRLREAAQQAEISDKDSSDPLSELDKQEQLLQNIDSKNKHIKRLLKEIEVRYTYTNFSKYKRSKFTFKNRCTD